MSSVVSTSRSLSPTRSTIAWKLSSAAMPCWMLLMTAISAARCSVSLSSRCVSSKSRALSQRHAHATTAIVVSRRTSGSPNACSRSWFSMLIVPTRRSPTTIGTIAVDSAWSVPGMAAATPRPALPRCCRRAACVSAQMRSHRSSESITASGIWSRDAVLDHVQVLIVRVAWSIQLMLMSSLCSTSRSLSPTSSTMPWKSSEPGDALLDAVDDGELARRAAPARSCARRPCAPSPAAKRTLASATAAWLASIASRSRSPSWKRPKAPSMSQ